MYNGDITYVRSTWARIVFGQTKGAAKVLVTQVGGVTPFSPLVLQHTVAGWYRRGAWRKPGVLRPKTWRCVCVLCYYERHNERLAGESNVFLCVCDMVRVEKKSVILSPIVSVTSLACNKPRPHFSSLTHSYSPSLFSFLSCRIHFFVCFLPRQKPGHHN